MAGLVPDYLCRLAATLEHSLGPKLYLQRRKNLETPRSAVVDFLASLSLYFLAAWLNSIVAKR